MPAPISGWRRQISSKIATGRRPGTPLRRGTISLSQTAASGSLSPARSRGFLLRRQPGVLLNAISRRRAEPDLGRGNARRLGLTQTHEQPHLAIGDVAAGQGAVPHRHEEPASYPAGYDRQTTQPLAGPSRSPDSRLQSGCALPASSIRPHFLIQIAPGRPVRSVQGSGRRRQRTGGDRGPVRMQPGNCQAAAQARLRLPCPARHLPRRRHGARPVDGVHGQRRPRRTAKDVGGTHHRAHGRECRHPLAMAFSLARRFNARNRRLPATIANVPLSPACTCRDRRLCGACGLEFSWSCWKGASAASACGDAAHPGQRVQRSEASTRQVPGLPALLRYRV